MAKGLKSPVAFTSRHGSRFVYVAEQNTGRVVAFDPLKPDIATMIALDLHGAVSQGNEQGLLGIAFSLDGLRLYIDYTDPVGDSHIDEYSIDRDGRAIATTKRQLLVQKQPFANHNGGQLAVGRDGMLYIAFGDGGLANDPFRNGQNLSSLLGKILRIDPRPNGKSPYSAPADNPFAHQAGARPEIWHWGLRNPWRFSFDRTTNDLWIADVGQNLYEEIDHAAANKSGINFGWNRREGTHDFNGAKRPAGAVDPVLDYAHDNGNCSVTGGAVFRGASVPTLQGIYIFADFCAGNLIGIDARPGLAHPAHADLNLHVDQPTSFGEDNDGNVYVLSRAGTVARIDVRCC